MQKNDPVMKRVIKAVGPCTIKTRRDRFHTLVNSIVSQQISGAAARTILGRVVDACGDDGITPPALAAHSVESLREAGVSRQKATYILDLATGVDAGDIELRNLGRKNNEDVITELTKVKGIGRWTAQMFLMFSLGRLDVFPVDDLGIQNGIRKAYGFEGDLKKPAMELLAEKWNPYETVASWYLWRCLDQ